MTVAVMVAMVVAVVAVAVVVVIYCLDAKHTKFFTHIYLISLTNFCVRYCIYFHFTDE